MIINNAGLVILHAYIPRYFERLGLLSASQFVSDEAQQNAAHHLQYLVAGEYESEEFHLSLNKLLCGLDIDQPLDVIIQGDDESKLLANSLLQAAISNWPAIGASTVEGFRGAWLSRDGRLDEKDDVWQLTVEAKAYDMLLDHLPMNFSLVKFVWMEKPLAVRWRG